MKLLYLGTAAAEGIPAVFCSCGVCQEAKEKKGKNIRSRSQALVDGRILLDFPPDSFYHYIASGFTGADLPSIRHVFITHTHSDHFYADELFLRRPVFVASEPLETLHVYGNTAVKDEFLRLEKAENCIPAVDFRYAKPFDPIKVDDYSITPFPALHDRNQECLFYSIEKEGKALLYAHDTGFFIESVWEHFSKTGVKFSMVSLDCTTVLRKDGTNHMGLVDCAWMRKKLISAAAADSKTIFVLNHFSHNGGLNHDELCEAAGKDGFIVAYDGLEIETP